MTTRHASSRQDATRRQLPAIEPRVSAWVEANAGTGKTKVLTDRIVRLLLDDVRPERILCLTFTKAAAAEMRNRLSAMLGRWAFADADTLASELEQVLDRRPSEGATLAARKLFARVLDAPGGIAIQTIHAFCQSLLKRFPLEAGVAPNADVLDETQAEQLVIRARDQQLRAIADGLADPELVAALSLVGERVSDSEYIDLMHALLAERGRVKRIAATPDGFAGVEQAIRDQLGVAADSDRASLIQTACNDTGFDLDGLGRAAAALARGSKTDVDRALPITHRGWHTHPSSAPLTLDDYGTAFFRKAGGIRRAPRHQGRRKTLPRHPRRARDRGRTSA